MELEVINTNYMLKRLAVDIKDLDKTLTQYLINDIYKPKEVDKIKVFNEISYIKNMLEYISQRYKEETMQQDELYSLEDIIEMFAYVENEKMAWDSLLEIKDKVNKKENIKIEHDKGFDFGFGSSNFSSLSIRYLEKIDNSIYSKQILNISTTNGKIFRIFKNEEYYELLNLDKEDYRRNINREISCNTIEETVENIDKLLIPVGEILDNKGDEK